ncbi:MAG: sugar phosphate isomerase/epimerase family protein [Monoglobaceae bacterium]
MYQLPIGIMLDSLRLDTASAIKKASELGAKGLQMYASSGEFAPENMSKEKRHELLDIVKSHGMVFSALCGDLGQGFGDAEKNPALIEKSKRILDLAKDLETDVVTTHIGVIPKSADHPRYKIMQEACAELSRYADSVQAHFAIETGPETSLTLKGFLDSLGSRGVAVNLDPANLVMVTGDDPVQAVYNLKDYIVHTHAKDGIKLRESDPEVIYGIIEDVIQEGAYFRETPLGEGDVPFAEYLKALEDIEYRGFLTIEREVGADPAADILLAVDFLNKSMN